MRGKHMGLGWSFKLEANWLTFVMFVLSLKKRLIILPWYILISKVNENETLGVKNSEQFNLYIYNCKANTELIIKKIDLL